MPLKKPPKRKSLLLTLFKWLFLFGLLFVGTFVAAGYFFLLELDKELPNVEHLQSVQYQTPLEIYSQDKLLMAQFGEKRSIPLPIEKIPQQQINAFLAAEDDRFYQHNGYDIKGLLRAANQLWTTGKKRQGGSTITMQVVRNFLLSNEKTYLRKIKEIMLAIKIEQRYSKQQIMALYLNKIYMGQRAYGIAAAALTYYGKDLADLDLAQQAMIAGLPKAPSNFNPIVNPDRALERRNYVLRRMLELNYISASDYQQALAKPDDAALQTVHIEMNAPYIAEMVRQEMFNKYGEEAYTQGFRVYTTVLSELQTAADHAVQTTLHDYDERHGYRGHSQKATTASNNQIGDSRQAEVTDIDEAGVTAKFVDGTKIAVPKQNIAWAQAGSKSSLLHVRDLIWVRQLTDQSWALTQIPTVEGAFVALNPNNGAILALSGGFDFNQSNYNRATQTKRQPGSGFKPIIYATALEQGFTLASIINDAPIVIADPYQENDWRPENYSKRFLGPISIRVALRESINMVAIRLLQEVGVSRTIKMAMKFGFDKSQLPGSLSLALGSGSASPLTMAEAYAVFANGGFAVKPYLIDRIEDPEGKIIFLAAPDNICTECAEDTETKGVAPRVLSAKLNFLMNSLLRDVVQRGTATAAKQLGRNDLAGKTGTTNDMRDAWFNGFTSDLVASAWLGFDNSTSLGHGETGGKAALPMWMDFMKTALRDVPEKPLIPPPGIIAAYINPQDGLLLKQDSKNGIWEYFTEESVPTSYSMPKITIPDNASESDEGLF